MTFTEEAFVIDCDDDSMVAVLTRPKHVAGSSGVLVVVGGPQYRVGSHRQFVVLSRRLAQSGIPCLRVDYRGMGDSTGDARDFTVVDDDIRAAVDALLDRERSLSDVVLWGLCDGATASAFYAAQDDRVRGLVLLNPWVHTEQAEAKVYLRHYYLSRLTSTAFWRKFVAGELNPVSALRGAFSMIGRARSDGKPQGADTLAEFLPLPERLYRSLSARPIRTLILLSGKDFVAREFENLISEKRWARLVATARVEHLPDADHTFSDPREALAADRLVIDWINARTANS